MVGRLAVWGLLRAVWRKQPPWLQASVRAVADRSGLSYVVWHMVHFQQNHLPENYVGNLPVLKRTYDLCDGDTRSALDKRFEQIMDGLVLENGVTKKTYAKRHEQLLDRVFSDPRATLNGQPIAVLDVPSSAGMSSMNAYEFLARRFTVERYVLGDRFFNVYVDEKRNCVFDEEGHLIQVRTDEGYLSVYRPCVAGKSQTPLVRMLMFSLDRRTRELQRRFLWEENHTYTLVRLVHPEVERALQGGCVQMHKFDVFAPSDDQFDLILSFNLLQSNYFPTSQIRQGVENLGRCLKEGGLLVLGETTTFTVYRKSSRDLTSVWEESWA